MRTALWLFAIQGAIGAFDTIYYHEWRARLPARGAVAAPELKLHAVRDFFYAVLFGTLPWLAWQGLWAAVLVAVILAEIVITLWDFVIETTVRKSFGDVYAGERVTHAAMGIIYGAMLANLLPVVWGWWPLPTAMAFAPPAIPEPLRWGLSAMAAGVFASGVRDMYAALQLRHGSWPWGEVKLSEAGAAKP